MIDLPLRHNSCTSHLVNRPTVYGRVWTPLPVVLVVQPSVAPHPARLAMWVTMEQWVPVTLLILFWLSAQWMSNWVIAIRIGCIPVKSRPRSAYNAVSPRSRIPKLSAHINSFSCATQFTALVLLSAFSLHGNWNWTVSQSWTLCDYCCMTPGWTQINKIRQINLRYGGYELLCHLFLLVHTSDMSNALSIQLRNTLLSKYFKMIDQSHRVFVSLRVDE